MVYFNNIFAATSNPIVRIETSKGDVIIELYPEQAPATVKNFLRYVDDEFYDGTLFHRVIKDFMIQGGGFVPGLQQRQTYPPIENEADNGLKNDRGTIAMARTGVIDSATSQFFINLIDNDYLNYRNSSSQGYGYCVFGKVISGLNVVDEISQVKTVKVEQSRYVHYSDVPEDDVLIKKVTVLRNTMDETAE
ncbi:MAG: peptidyl-prolyl cis-trans isomerase [bacterium]|nr:peptidyl-prolyl cis-trans isomerase [bacterium]